MIKIPPYLEKGDKIGVVAPAGFMPVEKMQACIETLDSWGYTPELGATTHSESQNYFSGTDDERLEDFQRMLDDKKIKAILCARGGYGMSRIIDRIDFKAFKKNPKWVIGYSDITVFHTHVLTNQKVASMHAPMAAAFNDGEPDNPYIKSLRDAMEGKPSHYETAGHHLNKPGQATGVLIGGNLSLLAHVIGSRSDFKSKNKILFLEDIGEYLYNIDRLLLQLKRSDKLDKIAGLIIGGFTEVKDTERPFGKEVHDIIHEHIKDADFPVCFGFPVSHSKENYALKIGVEYQLEVGMDKTSLKE